MVFREFLKVKSSNTSISCINIMYIDILVFGKSQEEHNLNLRAVFKQPQEKYPQQRQVRVWQEEVGFFWVCISPDPNKAEGVVILKHQPLQSSEVRSLLRVMNY